MIKMQHVPHEVKCVITLLAIIVLYWQILKTWTHQPPDSNPPLLRRWARVQITRHVAFRGGSRAVGQRLMAVLIVIILHMHLAAGDQTLAVALATAGWALRARINHWREITTVFLTGNVGDVCPFHITGIKGAYLHKRAFWRVKYCEWAFYNQDLKPLRGEISGRGSSPQSIPRWSRWIHRHGCCSSLCPEVWSGSRSTSHEPPAGCGPHIATIDVGGRTHTIYYTVVGKKSKPNYVVWVICWEICVMRSIS